MKTGKRTCFIHKFSYHGDKCPFCEKDRLDGMARKFCKQPKTVAEEEIPDREVTQDDLEKLKLKFNLIKGKK